MVPGARDGCSGTDPRTIAFKDRIILVQAEGIRPMKKGRAIREGVAVHDALRDPRSLGCAGLEAKEMECP